MSSRPGSPLATFKTASSSSPVSTAGLQVGSSTASNHASKALDSDLKLTTPHELVGWVDVVIGELENKFEAMSTDVLGRLSTLSTRIDSLEASLLELTQGSAAPSADADVSFPASDQGEGNDPR